MKYTIGVDFGSLSGRAVLVEVETGNELASSVYNYPHGVMDEALPTGEPLGHDWALQHPQDYLNVFFETIPNVIEKAKIDALNVIGIGIDFTACTFLPTLEDGTPLCLTEEFKRVPHAWVKLWKHHAAQKQADAVNKLAEKNKEGWLKRYGGKISSEWEVPKVLEIIEDAPEVYAHTRYFMEAADWVVWMLSGKLTRNTCTAGYKGIWSNTNGYPSSEYFKQLNPLLENYVKEKLDYPLAELGGNVGFLTKEMAHKLGLSEHVAIATANVDAHVTVPALGIVDEGKMLAIIGTSTCHILLSKKEVFVPGMCGVVDGGVYPDFYGYEAGQSCVGDHFAWFIKNCVPNTYTEEAKKEGKNIHVFLREKANQLKVGESGLVALDWWNGNRSVLVDVDLTGLIVGLTLKTKPEEIYRALIEATAFGTRKIVETFRSSGITVDEFYASGGISKKDAFMMQVYADVLNMPVKIASSENGPALGSSIFAAVAAGTEHGGFVDILSAAKAMGKVQEKIFYPNKENVKIYDSLYEIYNEIHDYFGIGAHSIMKKLKKLCIQNKGEK